MVAFIMSTSRNSPVSDGKWERFKEIIRSLWETHTLSEMMKIMADDPNFHATWVNIPVYDT